jgi:hypothetical protein
MICPKCKAEIPDSKFCPECGQALKALATVDQRAKVARPEISNDLVEGSFRIVAPDISHLVRIEPSKGLFAIVGDEGKREDLVHLKRSTDDGNGWEPTSTFRLKPQKIGEVTLIAVLAQLKPGWYELFADGSTKDFLVEEGEVTYVDLTSDWGGININLRS